MLGADAKFFTIYMFGHYLRSVAWHAFFQSALAVSRLVDVDPAAVMAENVGKIGRKTLKILHIFELLNPQRSQEELDKEYSADLAKVVAERKGLPPPDEQKAIEGEKADDDKKIEPAKLEEAAADVDSKNDDAKEEE